MLAAFENDDLVRDPDQLIAGTGLVRITVDGSQETHALSESFKITEALELFGPGTEHPEQVTGAPTLRWADDSSEDRYTVQVYNACGELVWETETASVSGLNEISVDYGGPTEPGVYYQFRATSWRDTNRGESAISATEDLRGVFLYE